MHEPSSKEAPGLLALLAGIRFPVLQAPIGGSACPALASAVSQAGGLGALALTWLSRDDAVRQVLDVKAATVGGFQANFALVKPPTALDAVLDAGVPCITFSWGDARPYVRQVKRAGAACGVQVATLAGAREARDAGADFLVCQGYEAGGHVQGSRPLAILLGELSGEANLPPVIAAGGIADGAGIARVMAAGAAGAMLGTRFVATQESMAHPLYKQALVDASSEDSVMTVCFDGGWPYAAHRVLHNRTLQAWESAGSPQHGARPGEGNVVAMRPGGPDILRYDDTIPLRTMRGQILDMALYAGQGCGAIHDLPSAGPLASRLWSECQAATSAMA